MELLSSLQSIRFRFRTHALHMLVGPNVTSTSIMISIILVMSFILGGMAADSPRQQESFSEIIQFPLFSYENISLKGVYFAKMRLGNPPQEFNVLVDTGSDPSWVNCRSNEVEMTGMRGYDMEQSATASHFYCPNGNKKPCHFEMSYYDGNSVFGFKVRDELYYETFPRNLSLNLSSSIEFGCINHRSVHMIQEIEGILGLGPGNNSIIRQLSSQHVAPQIFSHCFSSQGAGFLIFGQVSDVVLVYTPIVSKSKYKVIIESIAVNGETLTIDPRVFQTKQGTTVDSGAQISLLVAEAYDALINVVSTHLNQAPYLGPRLADCYSVSASETFPTILFKFKGGASLSLRPNYYLFEVRIWPNYYLFENIFDGQSGWCISFRRGTEATILGAPVLSDKIIVYDLIHRQIGWVEHDCSQSLNVSLTYDVENRAGSCSWKMGVIIAAMLVHSIFIL